MQKIVTIFNPLKYSYLLDMGTSGGHGTLGATFPDPVQPKVFADSEGNRMSREIRLTAVLDDDAEKRELDGKNN